MMNLFLNKCKRIIVCALAVLLTASVIPLETASAYISSVANPAKVYSFESTSNKNYERLYCKVEDSSKLKIQYQSLIEADSYLISLYRVSTSSSKRGDINLHKSSKAKIKKNKFDENLYCFNKTLDFKKLDVPNGYYNLYIERGFKVEPEIAAADSMALASASNAASASNVKYEYDNVGVCYKNMEIYVKGSRVYILRYNDIKKTNQSEMDDGGKYLTSYYLDESLDDIRFVLRNPETEKYAVMTTDKISYMRSLSERICGKETSDYRKLLRIYEYVAANFFYDTIAFNTHSLQFANPYDNVYAFENGISTRNSIHGKVYTTCQGFSAIMISLARAQGIPTRLVYGHRLAVPNNDWRIEDNIDVKDHWWLEAYVNGKWIFIDPTIGTSNKYNKNTGVFVETGLTNYTFFDPTKDQIATSHVYMNVYPDYRYPKYLTNSHEERKLLEFLNTPVQSSDGQSYPYYSYYNTNIRGKMLNPGFIEGDKTTWGDGIRTHFMTDGKGNVEQLQWSDYDFSGKLDLSGFEHLKLLSMRRDGFNEADLSGCKRLKDIYLDGNPLKSVYYYYNNNDRSISCEGNGTFGIIFHKSWPKPLKIISKPDLGYKVGRIVNTSNGNTLSKSKSYSLKPKCLNIKIKFVLDPDSYRYYLTPEKINSKNIPYLQASTKRLNELGYYTPYTFGLNVVGQETIMTRDVIDAITKFQVVNGLNNTGNIGRNTWEILFSDEAVSMPSYSEYQTILRNYEEQKRLEEEAKALAEQQRLLEEQQRLAEEQAKLLEE